MPRFRSTLAPVITLLVAVTAAATTAPARAQLLIPGAKKTPEHVTTERLVKVRLAPDVPSIRPGETFHLAVIFEIEPEWHIYWLDPGAAGAPTEVVVQAPIGYTVGATLYPRPKTIPDPAGASYGYEHEVALFVPITAPAQIMPGLATASFEVEVFFFVCSDRCLIGKTKRTVRIDVADPRNTEATPAPVPAARIIDRFKQRLPRPLTEIEDGSARVERTPEPSGLVISGVISGAMSDVMSKATTDTGGLAFLPAAAPGVAYGEAEIEIDDNRFTIRVPLEVKRQNTLGRRLHAGGLLTVGEKSDQPCYQVDVDLDEKPTWDEHR